MRRGFAILAGLVALAAAAPAAEAAGRCGSHPWCDTSLSPDRRAELLTGALTLEEKIGMLGGDEVVGVLGGEHTHTGVENGVPRVGLPPVFYSDGPLGPRQGKTTAMPAPMAVAATFDPRFARLAGGVIGNEARSKGNDVVFAPTVNVMRTPLGGRTFESYGEDPHLVTRMTVAAIEGMQSEGVIANVKHFALNNQEGYAGPLANVIGRPGVPLGVGLEGNRLFVDVRVGERAMREVYLPQFEAAVKEANVGSVMCSYNRLGGEYTCENGTLLERILRGEWGFKGYVLADYGGAHNTVASLQNGLDFEPWPPIAYQPLFISAAVGGGIVSRAKVDEHVRRTLRTLFAYGFFDRAAFADDDRQINKSAHAGSAREISEASVTLLKNAGGLLPLERKGTIAVIGRDGDRFKTGGGSGNVVPFAPVTLRAGIAQAAGSGVQVRYDDGTDLDRAAALARNSDLAVVAVGDYQIEGVDRYCLSLQCPDFQGDQDGLVAKVAAANPRTVVVLQTGGPVLTPWRDGVPAIVEGWYPGQQGGEAIARVLFGDADPGGRLPATFPRREADLPTAGDPERYPGVAQTVHYKEGLLVGYRWFDARGIEPAFPFGFGLSYTKFAYGDLEIRPDRPGAGHAVVEATVKNVGKRKGSEVAQLYLGVPGGAGVTHPPQALRGFEKVTLKPGRRQRVRFRLDPRSFSYWDERAHDWRIAPGCHRISVGASSRDARLGGTLARAGARCPPPCAAATGAIRGSSLGRVKLGRARGRVRLGFPSFARERAAIDRFCLAGKRRVRVGFVRGRAAFALTDSKRYGASGVRPGDSARALARRTGARRVASRGREAWYARTGRKATRLYRLRAGNVREVGIAERKRARNPAQIRSLLRRAGLRL